MVTLTPIRRRIISGLFVNLSAAWFTAAALTPNLTPLVALSDFLVLTYDILGGMMFLVLATVIEERL